MQHKKVKNIPVVILCGGMGTRLAEQTEVRPKPLVEIGGRPTLWHIMKHYSRFGALEFQGVKIAHFKERSTLHEGWINGGFFVIEQGALDYIRDDVMWEHAPMETLTAQGKVCGYQHEGFWQCMDTARDLRYLESLWEGGRPPWKTW